MKPEQEQIRYGLTPGIFTCLGPVIVILTGAAMAKLLFIAVHWLQSLLQ